MRRRRRCLLLAMRTRRNDGNALFGLAVTAENEDLERYVQYVGIGILFVV